jgi:hypothetical protein
MHCSRSIFASTRRLVARPAASFVAPQHSTFRSTSSSIVLPRIVHRPLFDRARFLKSPPPTFGATTRANATLSKLNRPVTKPPLSSSTSIRAYTYTAETYNEQFHGGADRKPPLRPYLLFSFGFVITTFGNYLIFLILLLCQKVVLVFEKKEKKKLTFNFFKKISQNLQA